MYLYAARVRRFAVALFAITLPLYAQTALTTASLSGTVADSTGAVIAGATIAATQSDTAQARTVHTDGAGRFRLPYLPVGVYSISASQLGFRTVQQNVQLTVGGDSDLSFTLSVANANTTLDVQAQTPVLETNRSQMAHTVAPQEINDLPYLNRNYLDLALLVPGVSPTNTNSTQTFAETSSIIGQGYSVSSQRNFSNNFVVDGLSASDDAAGTAGNVYSMDAVREFQVVTSGGQAEVGRALGGYFNVITRSGTNKLHGALYGYLRNQRLNTQNPLTQNRLPLTQAQYGATLSGPVRRDRTFLFGNFEERRLHTSGITTIRPTDASAINTRLIAVGYAAPLLAVSSATTLFPATVYTSNTFLRADHRFNPHDDFNIRYSLYRLRSTNARGVGALAAASNGTAVNDTNHTIAMSNIAALSGRTYNETRAQFTNDDLAAPPNDEIGPTVAISGVATFGRFSSSPTGRKNRLYEVVNNFVTQRGAHTLKTGIDLIVNDDTITFPQSLRGAYTFSSLANFLSGTYNTQGFTQSFGTPNVQQTNPNVGLYIQDAWKATRSLTINAGLRYDLQFLNTIATDRDNVSPRIGFAWTPFVAGKTVVRGSYGLFYDRIPLRALANALLSASNTTDPAQARLLSYTFSPSDASAPTFPGVAAAPPAASLRNYALMDRHIQNAYAQQASLAIEQQLAKRTTVELGYQHLRGLHLITSVNQNINADGTRPDPTRGNVKTYSSSADSYYDGLSVSLVQRAAAYGSMRLSYMWSKSMNDVGEFFFSAPINNFFVGQDRGRSDDDQRHRLVIDGVLNSPITRTSNFATALAAGWQLSGTLQYYSKLPFNIVTGGTTKQGTTQRPCTGSVTPVGHNACTRALPGAVIGRNTGIGFDFFQMNARLGRTFHLGENLRLQTAVEAFNALNHRNDMLPNGTWGTGAYPTTPSTNFGKANGVADPRGLQLLARFSF